VFLKWSSSQADHPQVTTSIIARAARLGALALSVVAAASSVVVLAAGSDAMDLVVADPLPGYTHSAAGALNGPIDVAELMILNGADSNDIPAVATNFKGQARTWINDAGSVAAVMVIDCGDEHSATDFLRGALKAQTKADAVAFETGMSGSLGFTMQQPKAIVHSVIWRQGKYFVQVFGAISGPAALTQEDAKALALLQADFLRSIAAAEPSADVASATDPQESSSAYQFGRVIGTLAIPGVLALVVIGRKRAKDRERAHQAMFAVPLPPFRAGSPLPPPAFPMEVPIPTTPPLAQPFNGFAPPQVNEPAPPCGS
jgi:hypothetical protein